MDNMKPFSGSDFRVFIIKNGFPAFLLLKECYFITLETA